LLTEFYLYFQQQGRSESSKDEIETFNKDLKLACLPVWLTSEEARQGKLHESVILAFKSEEEAKKALRNQLVIAGVSVRTAVYLVSKLTDQCKDVRSLVIIKPNVKIKKPVNFALATTTRQRQMLAWCPNQRNYLCTHTVYKCVNCQEKHQSNSVECSVLKHCSLFRQQQIHWP
jgi:hypothetical protein